MQERCLNLIKIWEKKNIKGSFCADKGAAAEETLKLIPLDASVGISGSLTLDKLGIVNLLEKRGNKVYNQYQPGIDRQESLNLRKKGACEADFYLTSANAVAQTGELVFFSGYGNRTAGISYAKNVIVVCGINKITSDIAEALKRAREYATPLNCKRLNWPGACLESGKCHNQICLFPEYKRMCCQVLIIEAEVSPVRLKVILVGEELGF